MKTGTAFRFMRSAALVAGLVLPLAGCESFDLTNLIPDTKKKLPGERREVFPGGVPGVSQGVPQELVKGYQAPPETAAVAPAGRARRAARAGARAEKRGRQAETQAARETNTHGRAGISAIRSGAGVMARATGRAASSMAGAAETRHIRALVLIQRYRFQSDLTLRNAERVSA
jgi:hypothetical protein